LVIQNSTTLNCNLKTKNHEKLIKTTLAIAMCSFAIISCSKKDDLATLAPEVNGCDTKNYGIVTVTFTNLTERHSIITTLLGTPKFKIKNIAKELQKIPFG
jgi:hypothetical protein